MPLNGFMPDIRGNNKICMNVPQQRDVLGKVQAVLRNKTNLGGKVNLTELEPGCRCS